MDYCTFQGSLEETSDDKSAMQLIGLLLLKYYRAEALEPYLKLLCSSGIRYVETDAKKIGQAQKFQAILPAHEFH